MTLGGFFFLLIVIGAVKHVGLDVFAQKIVRILAEFYETAHGAGLFQMIPERNASFDHWLVDFIGGLFVVDLSGLIFGRRRLGRNAHTFEQFAAAAVCFNARQREAAVAAGAFEFVVVEVSIRARVSHLFAAD